MDEATALAKMIAPGTRRKGKYREGVIQIHLTRACDKACFGCTQGSNLRGKATFMTPENFELACKSLKGYFGVVGIFGGNPALHPQFKEICEILRAHFPREQRGLWCNHPKGNGAVMRETFDPSVSNLNVHLDPEAFDEFVTTWPESRPFGLTKDSRHSPPYVAMKDVLKKKCEQCEGRGKFAQYGPSGRYENVTLNCPTCKGTGEVYDEGEAWELISKCDINQHWSAMMGQFRGELRAWFCEIAGAQAMLHQDEPDYPDTGIKVAEDGFSGASHWWRYGMNYFEEQVRHHCHGCGVPLRGRGELAMSEDPEAVEQTSATHAGIYRPKKVSRQVQVVQLRSELGDTVRKTTDYLGNV